LINYAANHNAAFGDYINNNYRIINSRVAMHDLYKYAKLFGDRISKEFKSKLDERTDRIFKCTGTSMTKQYEQLLDWRHHFAHTGRCNTTVKEATKTHRLSKHVIYCFDDAFAYFDN
jgi:hypothetical protein